MDNDYEYEDMDFDSTDSGVSENHDSTASEIDQVTALILESEGEEYPEEERSRDNAKTKIFNKDGTEKTNNKTWTSTEVDAHGNRIFGGSKEFSQPKPERDPINLGSSVEHTQQGEQIQKQAQWLMNERQKGINAYESGQMSYEEFQQREYQYGMAAGQLQRQGYEHELNEYKLKESREASYKYLENELGDDWSMENRGQTAKEAIEWLNAHDIDNSLISDIDDPRVVSAVVKAMRATQRDDKQRDEIAGLKAQIRRLKGMRDTGRKKGQRSAQVGEKRGQDAVIDEVAALLSKGGHSR